MARSGLLIVISGPSGAGKGTVCKALLEKKSDLLLSISKTTRKPRAGEKDGVNYFFVTDSEFMEAVREGDFLEYACVYGHKYGTPRSYVEEKLAEGYDVILEIDPQGALQVMKVYPNAVFIFLIPPSWAELCRRIEKRGTESKENMKKRLTAAVSELKQAHKYGYIVVNDSVEEASKRIISIIEAEKLRAFRNADFINAVIKEGG